MTYREAAEQGRWANCYRSQEWAKRREEFETERHIAATIPLVLDMVQHRVGKVVSEKGKQATERTV